VKEFAIHVDHIQQVIGVDHVSVATGGPCALDRLSPHHTTPELSEIGHWKSLAVELHSRGYAETTEEIFGLNLVTLFRQVLNPDWFSKCRPF